MFATAMLPPTFGGSTSLSLMPAPMMSPYRPTRPSPLSSSPIPSSPPMRASSPIRGPPSPTPAARLFSLADTQSSPVQPSSSSSASPWLSTAATAAEQRPSVQEQQQKSFLRFASRPAKTAPRQTREATRQTRRSLFLRNVRQRANDQSWDRRNCEQEIQKLEWWSLEREIRQAKEADSLSMLTENDFEDAAEWTQHPSHLASSASSYAHYDDSYDNMDDDDDLDERMAELLAREEEAELEAMMASVHKNESESDLPPLPSQPQHQEQPTRPPSPRWADFSDDGDYDTLFAELLSGQTRKSTSEDIDMA